MCISFIYPFLFLLLNLLNSPTLVVGAIGDGDTYEYHVVGQLFCNGTPWQDQQIDMYDVDCKSSDDHMANGMTDKEGKFELRGIHADGWGERDPGGLQLPNPYLVTDKDCVPGYVNKLYLTRKQKEQDIIVHQDSKGRSVKYADGRAYPKCSKECEGLFDKPPGPANHPISNPSPPAGPCNS